MAQVAATPLAVLDHDQVELLLPMRECIEVVQEALKALDRGEYAMPLRTIYSPPGGRGSDGMDAGPPLGRASRVWNEAPGGGAGQPGARP